MGTRPRSAPERTSARIAQERESAVAVRTASEPSAEKDWKPAGVCQRSCPEGQSKAERLVSSLLTRSVRESGEKAGGGKEARTERRRSSEAERAS